MDPLSTISTRHTPQTDQADPRQVKNSAGGYTFTIDEEARLRRFLTLGTDGASYYTSAAELTKDNAALVIHLARTNHQMLLRVLLEVSEAGRAPRQNPTLFAYAIACSIGADDERSEALRHLHQVARTGTHLFIFAGYVQQFRGWGRGLRSAVGDWYLRSDVDDVAFQAVKYRQREGWTHRDLLRKAHPQAASDTRRALFDWIVRGNVGDDTPFLIEGYLKAQEPGADVPGLIRAFRLGWEMLPDAALNKAATWEALLDNGIPQTALMRQLPRLTRLGLLNPLGSRTAEVAARLSDTERLKRGRIHPISVLVAARTYASGQSARGDSTWTPTAQIVDALDAAFYASFGAIESAGKRTMLALDVSGSMTAPISNLPLSCREASAAMALVTAATEPEHMIVGFTGGRGGFFDRRDAELTQLAISPRQRLEDAIRAVSGLSFGGTDCSLPMIHALKQGLEVDTFVVYTDNETYSGAMHPHQALALYRRETGIDARLVVVGMTATKFSIADPSDRGMLDIAGFDSAVPTLISDFSRGL